MSSNITAPVFGGQKNPTNIAPTETVTFGVNGYSSYTTAGPVTFTAADCVKGTILRDCNGAARADSLPSVAQLLPYAPVGSVVKFKIVNITAGAYTTTVSLGTGMTNGGARAIPQNNWQTFTIVITSSSAATVYTEPTETHNA